MIAEPISLAERKQVIRRDGMGYLWDPTSNENIRFRADYFTGRSEELHAEITVTRGGQHLHMARFNLSSTVSRKSLAATLERQTNGLDIRWDKMVEGFCVGILLKEREGEPTQYPGVADRRRLVYLIDNLVIQGKTNMLFAPGGSGKGYLCVGLCCAVASKRGLAGLSAMPSRPFYFDWEDDFETYEDRLNAVARGLEVAVPRIPYRRMRGLAAERINEIARVMADEGATLGIIDSFSAAGGTVSDRTGWDTIAHRLFDALDQVAGVTWLIIDHVTGENLKDPTGKAYGSIQKMNRVRNAWEMRSEQEPGSDTVHMKLFHAKWNHTGRKKPIGIRMEFSGDSVTFGSEDPVQVARTIATIPDRMALELDKGPLSTGMLAHSLNVSEAAIRAELSRNKGRFDRDRQGFVALRQLDPPDDREAMPW